MSNQPPPAFGGHPNYAQQWPPPFPPTISADFPTNVEYHAGSQMPLPNPAQHLDANFANFYANSHLAGATSHSHPGLFFPPPLPYMNQFQASQQPVATLPPAPMQSLGYLPMPAPPGSSIAQPTATDAQAADATRASRIKSTPIDRSREEGEISEEENKTTTASRRTRGAKRSKAPIQHSDLEEGETMSSVSSSRSSSPYNPSLPVAADPEVVSHAIEMQKWETTAAQPKEPPELVSAEQLRLRAQGALLSLKPHNISYDELVGEGLNPTILRKLYEQVGLKISSQVEKPLAPTASHPPSSTKQKAPAAPKIDQPRRKSSTAPPAPTPPAPSGTQTETEKPMERKELIARMLAAKAAKASAVTAKPAPEEPQSTTTPPLAAAPAEAKTKSNVVTVREKNKAKTELARQRIEELKRQALLKSQQKSQLAQNSQSSQVDQPSVPAAPAVQHPLPVRPPIPQPSGGASIPGLVMTGSKPESGLQTPTEISQAINLDSTPLSRASHRKRPRASDFDEPDAASKRQVGYEKDHVSHADRLVIEFSDDDDDDDESLYGEDPDTMEIDSDQDQGQPTPSSAALDPPRPALQKYPSSTSTPQGPSWQSDSENMRQKDLEIQEMRRRIAELEERRKAKIAASRTESPRTVDDSVASSSFSSASSSALQSHPADADVAKALPALAPKTAMETDQTTTGPPNESSLLDSLTESSLEVQAETKAEVGAGKQAVSTESQTSSDQPMSHAPVSELQPNMAAASLTRQSEAELPVDSAHPSTEASSSPHSGSMSSSMDESEDISSSSEASSSEEGPAATDGQQAMNSLNASVQPQDEATVSTPGGPDSTEDESSDSLDSDVSSSDQESIEDAEDSHVDHASPGRPSPALNGEFTTPEDFDNMDTRSEHSRRHGSLESESDESEAYEPPEPDADAEPSSPYSPPFSPAPHIPVEDKENPVASLDDRTADESLTGAPQVATSELHRPPQVETPGNNTSTSVPPGSKFTPYISPLRHFKAYRYHPAYTQNVSNGYRSLTYSHDIDAMKYFCPYELAGGVCNDRSCEFQHFRDINLSDDKILIEMGSVREGQTEEEREAYIAGLKEIINEMRRDKVKDFSTVASEIVAYRRRFLQDPSRVLPL